MILRAFLVVAALAAFDSGLTHADTRGTLRIGVMPLELVSSSDTPLFGDGVVRMVDKYNEAAEQYDRATGATTERLDTGDLGVTETLVVFAPGIEVGSGGTYFFRLEAPVGVSDGMTSVGVGVYPLNLQFPIGRSVAVYVSGGGSASWLDRSGPGDVGALVSARAAAGFRLARHVVVEVGYNAFVLGGSINNERLRRMDDPSAMDLVEPSQVISAGEARGIVDASVGLAF